MGAGAALFFIVGFGLVGVPFLVLGLGAGWAYLSVKLIGTLWFEQPQLRPTLGIATFALMLISAGTSLAFGRSVFRVLHRLGMRSHSTRTIRLAGAAWIALWAVIGAGTACLIVSPLVVWFVGGASLVKSVWASLSVPEATGSLGFWLVLSCGLVALLAGLPVAVISWHRMAISLLGLTEQEVARLAGGGPERWEDNRPNPRPPPPRRKISQ
jgi:hypothetical protein